jgi:hypothetical protein
MLNQHFASATISQFYMLMGLQLHTSCETFTLFISEMETKIGSKMKLEAKRREISSAPL